MLAERWKGDVDGNIAAEVRHLCHCLIFFPSFSDGVTVVTLFYAPVPALRI